MISVSLPWPPPPLWPNRRYHWSKKAKVAQAYKIDCGWCAIQARVGKIEADGINARITFCPPVARRRDLDNALAAIKQGIDAIAERTGVDDSKWSLTIGWGAPVKSGAVIIELEAA